MTTVQTFSAVKEGIVDHAGDLDELLAQLLASPGWQELQTRTARRLCDQYTFEGDASRPPPPHLRFAHGLVQRLLAWLRAGSVDDEVIPLSCFFCLYEDGDDACPSHSHDCRQLTMSFGDERALVVEDQRLWMRHGDLVILDGEQHGVPAQRSQTCQPRVSLNLFFATAGDRATRQVSVNHRSGNKYSQSRGGAAGGRESTGGKGRTKGKQEGGGGPHGASREAAAVAGGGRQVPPAESECTEGSSRQEGRRRWQRSGQSQQRREPPSAAERERD